MQLLSNNPTACPQLSEAVLQLFYSYSIAAFVSHLPRWPPTASLRPLQSEPALAWVDFVCSGIATLLQAEPALACVDDILCFAALVCVSLAIGLA